MITMLNDDDDDDGDDGADDKAMRMTSDSDGGSDSDNACST